MSNANPKIYVECSEELLAELHAAHEALRRSQVKARKAAESPQLERLMVAIASARRKAQPGMALQAPPSG